MAGAVPTVVRQGCWPLCPGVDIKNSGEVLLSYTGTQDWSPLDAAQVLSCNASVASGGGLSLRVCALPGGRGGGGQSRRLLDAQ